MMTEAWGWPQWVMASILVTECVIALFGKDGEKAAGAILGNIVIAFILNSGGFWG